MAVPNELVEVATRHQVFLERLKSGQVNQFDRFLKNIDRDIRRRLSGVDLTDYGRQRLKTLLKSVDEMLAGHFDEFRSAAFNDLFALAESEAGFEARAIDNIVVNTTAAVPGTEQVIAAIRAQPLSVRGPDGGKLLSGFFNDWTQTERSRFCLLYTSDAADE